MQSKICGETVGLFVKGIYLAVLGLSCGTRNLCCSIFSHGMWTLGCGMWDLVPRPEIEPRPPALGAQSLSHWTTREVPNL